MNRYRKKRNNIQVLSSLSKITQCYLKSMTTGDETKEVITPLVKSISGIIKFVVNKEYKND